MTTITNKKMVAVAFLAAATIAGCGDSSDDDQGSAAATSPAVAATTAPAGTTASTPDTSGATEATAEQEKIAKSPEGTWASRTCKAMAGKAKELQPPQVDTASPAGTQKSLATFFSSVVDQLGDQINTLEDVGPPPGGGKQESEWKSAVSDLRDVRKDVAKGVRNVKSADADNAKEIQSVIDDLGKQLGAMATYEGPIAELKKNATLGPALEAEPTCQQVS